MSDLTCQLLVLGAGPGGYVAAIRAGQLGVDTVIVDPQPPGGTCLNVGCVPSKALIHAADEFWKVREAASGDHLGISVTGTHLDLAKTVAWKDAMVAGLNRGVGGLLRSAGARLVTGSGRFLDGKTVAVTTEDGERRIAADTIVIATGSAPVELPRLPYGGNILSSTDALALTEVPDHLAVVGGGYIGLELGTAFAKLGSRVTIVEAEPTILPMYDAVLTRPVLRAMEVLGIRVITSALAAEYHDRQLVMRSPTGEAEQVTADKVLVTVGRRPYTDDLGLTELALPMDGPFIRVDDRCATAMTGVYAIGDVTGEPMLAHRAMAQGEMVAEIVAGHRLSWDRRAIPAITFTDPEVVSVGLSPAQAEKTGHTVVGQFPLRANARAMTLEFTDGFVRVVARADDHLILGISAVGRNVSELSSAFSLTIENGLRLEDVAGAIHAHPTQSEAFVEACFDALGRSLHN